MTRSYAHDRPESDRTIGRVMKMLADYFCCCDIRPSNFYEDTLLSVDLKLTDILRPGFPNEATVAARLRLSDERDYSLEFPNQMTIRAYRATGSDTELDKLIDGTFADYAAYGFYRNDRIFDLAIWDMTVVYRRIRATYGKVLGKTYYNDDGTGFNAIYEKDFPGGIIARLAE